MMKRVSLHLFDSCVIVLMCLLLVSVLSVVNRHRKNAKYAKPIKNHTNVMFVTLIFVANEFNT